jgi:hypothetical protein
MIDKKKLREDYRRAVPEKGIYMIKNLRNGRVFLGSSLNLHGVLNRNAFTLKMRGHKNSALQNDWNTLGEGAFQFEILETLKLQDDPAYDYDEDLKILEMIWIEKFRPFEKNCYNPTETIRTV